MFKDKGIIIGIVLTILLVAGGVFLMTRGGSTNLPANTPVASDILVPQGANQTSGIENGNYLSASSSAKVTLVEFGDYECPACAVYSSFVKELLTNLPGKINFVFRSYPLTQHANSMVAAQAAEAAALQGKFWQMHDKLYESVSEWSASTDAKNIFINYAQDLGLDVNKFKVDIDSQIVKNKIQNDVNDGNKVNLTETPTIYLNGVKIKDLTGSYADFQKIISGQL